MEIITFDREVYRDLSEKIGRIADYVFKKEAQPQHTPEIWLTSEELADLLKISTRTLQRLRKERVVPVLSLFFIIFLFRNIYKNHIFVKKRFL